MLSFLFAATARAECPPAALATVMQHVGEMKAAYVGNDVAEFDEAGAQLVAVFPCVDDPLSLQIAVEIHHVLGIRAFANQDPMGAQRSLSAVRELAPEWRPNEDTFEPGSPMLSYYEMVLPSETIPLAATPPGGWLIDGTPGTEIPGHRAFILQAVGRDEEILFSGIFASPATLPVFDYSTGEGRRNIRIGGTIGAGALLVGALASEIAAVNARGSADDPALAGVERLALLERSRTLQTVAIGLGIGGAVGAGITWAIPW